LLFMKEILTSLKATHNFAPVDEWFCDQQIGVLITTCPSGAGISDSGFC